MTHDWWCNVPIVLLANAIGIIYTQYKHIRLLEKLLKEQR